MDDTAHQAERSRQEVHYPIRSRSRTGEGCRGTIQGYTFKNLANLAKLANIYNDEIKKIRYGKETCNGSSG